MIFCPFQTAQGDLGYLLADPVTGEAALIDPNLSAADNYLSFMQERGLRLRYVLETHVHESHNSAAAALQELTGAAVLAAKDALMKCVSRPVEQGEEIYLGEETLSVLETPGHSSCSLSYLWHDRVFTGHTLLAGTTGHCLRNDSSPDQLYDSVKQVLFTLPPNTLVFPGHIVNGQRESSIAREQQENAELNAGTSREVFVAGKQQPGKKADAAMQRQILANRDCLYGMALLNGYANI